MTYVTDKVIAGEFNDFPSSCSDVSLEEAYFCDSHRRESGANSSKAGKPWSGFPYPFCVFYNEGAGCHKKVCNLKHAHIAIQWNTALKYVPKAYGKNHALTTTRKKLQKVEILGQRYHSSIKMYLGLNHTRVR